MDSIGRFEMLDFKSDVVHWRKKDKVRRTLGAIQQSAFGQEFELDHDGFGEPLDLQIGFDMIRFVRNDRQ